MLETLWVHLGKMPEDIQFIHSFFLSFILRDLTLLLATKNPVASVESCEAAAKRMWSIRVLYLTTRLITKQPRQTARGAIMGLWICDP